MFKLLYLWSKLFKKLRGKAVYNSVVDRTAKIEAGSQFVNSKIGRHSFCGYDCAINNTVIGSFCSVANNVKIGGASHPMHFISTSPVFLSHKDSVKKKLGSLDFLPQQITEIGNDVWIGESVIIKAGVKIGHGAVVGMGSVVTKNVAPYSVVAGVPAEQIRMRFDDEIIDELLESEWWDLDDISLAKLGIFVDSPDKFLKELKKL